MAKRFYISSALLDACSNTPHAGARVLTRTLEPCAYYSTEEKRIMRTSTPLHYRYAGTSDSKRTKDELAADEQRLHHAMYMVAQSETGRFLLKKAHDRGYKFVFDDKYLKPKNYDAVCLSEPRYIKVRSDLSVEKVALNLVHELAHASQFSERALSNIDFYNPPLALCITHAIEADARSYEAAYALEYSLYQSGTRHNKNYPGNPVLAYFCQRYPSLSREALRSFINQKEFDDEARARIKRAVFLSYYNDAHLRVFYENNYLNTLGHVARQMMTPLKAKNTSKRRHEQSKKISDSINAHAKQPYLATAIHLRTPHFSGFTRKGHRKASALFGWRRASDMPKRKPRPKKIPRTFCLTNAANAAFKREPKKLWQYAFDARDRNAMNSLIREGMDINQPVDVQGSPQGLHPLLYTLRKIVLVKSVAKDKDQDAEIRMLGAILNAAPDFNSMTEENGLNLLEASLHYIAQNDLDHDIARNIIRAAFEGEQRPCFNLHRALRVCPSEEIKTTWALVSQLNAFAQRSFGTGFITQKKSLHKTHEFHCKMT